MPWRDRLAAAIDALRQLARGTFGAASTEREISEGARAKGLGVPLPAAMLEEARGLGAKVVACDTMVKVCGLGANELGRVVDEVMGLASIWRMTIS